MIALNKTTARMLNEARPACHPFCSFHDDALGGDGLCVSRSITLGENFDITVHGHPGERTEYMICSGQQMITVRGEALEALLVAGLDLLREVARAEADAAVVTRVASAVIPAPRGGEEL